MNFDMPVYEYAFLINKQNSENILSCNGVILTHSLGSMAVDASHESVTYNILRRVQNTLAGNDK